MIDRHQRCMCVCGGVDERGRDAEEEEDSHDFAFIKVTVVSNKQCLCLTCVKCNGNTHSVP